MTTISATPTVHSTQLKIGLEVHVELATRTKMFTRVPNAAHPDNYDAPPNTLIDPIVAALPGVLPVMNKRAVEMSMLVGMALGCRIAPFSKWDRKNYFYPDLPKGYQISQYDLPLCGDGSIDIPVLRDGGEPHGTKRIGIIRAHLEEDTGKLGHELPGGLAYDGSLVDLNRAGTPLLEIVTAPDFDSADDVVTFAQELRNICRFLGVTEGIMQRGHMRFEPNVNVIIRTDEGRQYATPIVEVKNLNSFKAVRGAIEHEHRRQVEQWLKDRKVMGPNAKSTRGWDDERGVTVLQREKEDAHDYRYFPDPDLVPVTVDEAWLNAVRDQLPELPLQRRRRFMEQFGLDRKESSALVDDRDLCLYYEACVDAVVEGRATTTGGAAGTSSASSAGLAVAKFLLNAGAKWANERKTSIPELGVAPARVAQIVALRESNSISAQAADAIFAALCDGDDDPALVAQRLGLVQERDEGKLDAWIDAAIAANAQAAEDVRSGKMAAIGRIVGHVMKLSGGQADAKIVGERIKKRLS